MSKNRLRAGKLGQHDQLSEALVASEREDLAFVWDAVGQLPVSYREVIHLYYHDGYTAEEIAQITNNNTSTVRSNLKRGREKLRSVLKEAYDFD